MRKILYSLRFHEFLVSTQGCEIKLRKPARRGIPKVKVKLALLDELAKHPKIESELSAKNKRNILVGVLC